MSKVTSRLLVAAVCAAMAFPTVSSAQDHGHGGPYPHYYGHAQHRNDYAPYRYYNHGVYRPYYYGGPAYSYRGYQPYYGYGVPYYYGHHHYDGNDDALWAIGGLVVGAIIGGAVAHANEHPPAAQSERNCDHVAYDSAGNPYVERSCDR
jgi:hypothetical protein